MDIATSCSSLQNPYTISEVTLSTTTTVSCIITAASFLSFPSMLVCLMSKLTSMIGLCWLSWIDGLLFHSDLWIYCKRTPRNSLISSSEYLHCHWLRWTGLGSTRLFQVVYQHGLFWVPLKRLTSNFREILSLKFLRRQRAKMFIHHTLSFGFFLMMMDSCFICCDYSS